MKAANGKFDQWREDAIFFTDQLEYSYSRCFYYEAESDRKPDLKPQLERWQMYQEKALERIEQHYKRGQRWQIHDSSMRMIINNRLNLNLYFIVAKRLNQCAASLIS